MPGKSAREPQPQAASPPPACSSCCRRSLSHGSSVPSSPAGVRSLALRPPLLRVGHIGLARFSDRPQTLQDYSKVAWERKLDFPAGQGGGNVPSLPASPATPII